ncbi:hypothetical protein [Pseudomonas trivialis]|nr:hypothetical protein [Pseudomonas trivialis]
MANLTGWLDEGHAVIEHAGTSVFRAFCWMNPGMARKVYPYQP